ncbi:NUDIX hydrolase [Sphingomonas sp. LHG3406-1]|uniref:NUDIX hydrolase n=1 Tax=Sphingomonas sp. LHG3406-1 TaxID=2804617 RepID=UPI0026143032|nr:NUDIX hydrolase [Sphingomonas sp. LHG3406-1]
MGVHTSLFRLLYTLEVPRLGGRPAQAGALCWRRREGRLEVLLVKTRSSGRWVIPGGWALRGRPLAVTAEREAWEEAGVRGAIANRLLAIVPKRKQYRLAGPIEWHVAVYPLRVEEVANDYPEAGERQRQWFSPKEAAKLVHPPALGPIIREVAGDA